MKRHYEFTGETKRFYDKKLYRIRATEDLPLHEVKQGELGGWIEKYENLAVYAWVADEAKVFGNARVSGNAKVYDNVWVYGNAKINGNTKVFGEAIISGNSEIYGNAKVFGSAKIREALIAGEAQIKDNNDYCVFSCFGSKNRITTFFKTKTKEVSVICGCFSGNLEEFKKKVIETHGNNKFSKEYLSMIKLAKIKFDLH